LTELGLSVTLPVKGMGSPITTGGTVTQQQSWTPDGPLLPHPGHTQPPKRSKLWLWITLAIAAPVIAGLLMLNWPKTVDPAPVTTTRAVTYEADSAGARGIRSGSITIQTPNGSSQAETNLPMKNQAGGTGLTYTFSPGAFVYLSVQNQDAAGSVTCRITVDGVVISENTSTGGYTIATCQGRVL
jgi:hypothetical protein